MTTSIPTTPTTFRVIIASISKTPLVLIRTNTTTTTTTTTISSRFVRCRYYHHHHQQQQQQQQQNHISFSTKEGMKIIRSCGSNSYHTVPNHTRMIRSSSSISSRRFIAQQLQQTTTVAPAATTASSSSSSSSVMNHYYNTYQHTFDTKLRISSQLMKEGLSCRYMTSSSSSSSPNSPLPAPVVSSSSSTPGTTPTPPTPTTTTTPTSSISERITQSIYNYTSKSIKDRILNEIGRIDSSLWSNSSSHPNTNMNATTTNDTNGIIINGVTTNINNSTTTTQQQYHVNGSNHLQHDNNNQQHHQQQHQHLNGINYSSSNHNTNTTSSNSTSSTINDSNHLSIDLLNDLYITEQTQYYPNLPNNISYYSTTNTNTSTTSTTCKVDPFQLVQYEIQQLSLSIQNDLIGTDHPVLHQAATYFFNTTTNTNPTSSSSTTPTTSTNNNGKKVRPMMVLLLSRALSETIQPSTSNDNNSSSSSSSSSDMDQQLLLLSPPILHLQRHDLPQAQRRLAEISEMIHTASLLHDDVIDGSTIRRNKPTVHTLFGNKMSILAGDYLLARASICLARLRNTDVVETMSTIIEHLVRGEVMQLRHNNNNNKYNNNNTSTSTTTATNEQFIYYLRKNFYKTASLMANSCKSTALLGNYSNELVQSSYNYGKHIGMSFQLIDDVLDYEGTIETTGKPSLLDLKSGILTAPILFAMESYSNEIQHSLQQLKSITNDPNTSTNNTNNNNIDTILEQIVYYINESNSIERTKNLARVHLESAIISLRPIKSSIYRDALIQLAYNIVSRTK